LIADKQVSSSQAIHKHFGVSAARKDGEPKFFAVSDNIIAKYFTAYQQLNS
jgi:hypothetical protein